MYYDGRKSLVQSLRTLVQGRTGVSWTLELDPEVEDLVDTFTDQLLEEGIVEKILGELYRCCHFHLLSAWRSVSKMQCGLHPLVL